MLKEIYKNKLIDSSFINNPLHYKINRHRILKSFKILKNKMLTYILTVRNR